LTATGIFLVALLVRIVAATAIDFPRPEDTAYYVGVARNIVEGRGLVSDALWSYGTPPLVFPRPAFEVWLPLPAFLFAVPLALSASQPPIALETAMRASQLITVALGSILAVLAWRLAADVARERALPTGRARTLAIGTGLTAAVYLPLVLHSAQPDSTVLFGVLALGACLLMTRVLRDPRGARPTDPRLLGLGLLLGAAALTRNEVVWLAVIWAWLAWRLPGATRADRIRLIGVVAVVSLMVFAPWAVRNWVVFGSPLPGQTAANALSITGEDIFAWNDPPTLSRYLAVGPAALLEMRVVGVAHNLLNVLVLLGIPLAVLGVLALPWQGRDRALRPVILLAGTTFLVTSLAFPVATTWGTFLHAAAPVHVLLIVCALGALDGGFARLSARFGWTRPVAWMGAVLAVGGSFLFSMALLPVAAKEGRMTALRYEVLARELATAGVPLDGASPVIHDFPIWLAETARVPTLALPYETPSDVLDLATDPRFGARLLVAIAGDDNSWPEILDGSPDPAAACFEPLVLPTPPDPDEAKAIEDVRVYRIMCDAPPTAAATLR
jgi:hypothetical protein